MTSPGSRSIRAGTPILIDGINIHHARPKAPVAQFVRAQLPGGDGCRRVFECQHCYSLESRHVTCAMSPILFGVKLKWCFDAVRTVVDPRRTFPLFSRDPLRSVVARRDLASNDIDVTPQIVDLIREG